jgi:hypothetical protein
VKLLDFMEETRIPLGVALGHEEPPRDPSFEYRWPFQLGKPLKGIHSIRMLATPEDFATKGNKVVWLEFKDIYEVYHQDVMSTDLIVAWCL